MQFLDDDGRQSSAPILPAEAGILHDDQGACLLDRTLVGADRIAGLAAGLEQAIAEGFDRDLSSPVDPSDGAAGGGAAGGSAPA